MKLPVILLINKFEFQMTVALDSSRLYYALSVHYINLTSHGLDDFRKRFHESIYFAFLY